MLLPFSLQEQPLSIKQGLELACLGNWGRGRLPSPPGEVDSASTLRVASVAYENKYWDSDNLRDAVIHAAMVGVLAKSAELKSKGVDLAERIAMLTSEFPNELNYGQGLVIESFLDNEFLELNKCRRNATMEARREYLLLKIAVEAARLMTLETMRSERPTALTGGAQNWE